MLLEAKDKDIIHIDECHQLDKPFQTALYLAVDKRSIFVNSKRSPQPIPIADFTLLFRTTDEFCLLQPLRDRMKLTLRFEFYQRRGTCPCFFGIGAKPLAGIVDQAVFPLIARRSRGTPRLALRLLQSLPPCLSKPRGSHDHRAALRPSLPLEQIDDLGLGPTEQKYLSILAEGPTRLNVISTILGLPTGRFPKSPSNF